MSAQEETLKIPDGFVKIINDFVTDILTTFPEYTNIVKTWWSINEILTEQTLANQTLIFKHCIKVFPERFFDILNKNTDIFLDTSSVNTEFLPGVVFKYLWKCEISDKTRETIWKYLQLILFSIVDNPSDMEDTFKIFENMDENILREKLAETMESMKTMFQSDSTSDDESSSSPKPSSEDIHSHLNDMMKGKLGKLAMDFAEETAQELNIDMENTTSTKDAFQKIFKNPANLMNVVKNIGSKLDGKIKSGEINESEIITEGMEILNKMKNVPGMENIQNMFSQMGLGKNAKMNMNAMEAQMKQNLKMAQMRERMKKKADSKQNSENIGKTEQSSAPLSDDQLEAMINSITNDKKGTNDKKDKKDKSKDPKKKKSKNK
jgi:hypothetical protein